MFPIPYPAMVKLDSSLRMWESAAPVRGCVLWQYEDETIAELN